jgi:pyrimidine-nucleoside phosphorylase
MTARGLIEAKRDGQAHSAAELRFLAQGAADGTIPDYQLSAWLMAAYLRGLDAQETADLTMAMAKSGETLDLTGLAKPWVDKHSTGGVGDKTTIVLLPLLAACGLTMVKMSGRGLGITGGTIDKLESVPGFRTDLDPETVMAQAAKIGLALTGQTPRLAPADKTLYALRDATGTVASIPLITSSILSKKIAGGAETVIVDVKCGSGAFMGTLEDAHALAESLERTGALAGIAVKTVVTDMDQPLGSMVGNALEVKEALGVLRGEPGPEPTRRFRELCVSLAGLALRTVGKGSAAVAAKALDSGAALAKAREWFAAQGADPLVFDSDDWAEAPHTAEVAARRPGHVRRVDARLVGQAAMELGAGRPSKTDPIDPTVGVRCLVTVGSLVQAGTPVFEVHAAAPEAASRAQRLLDRAIEIVDDPVDARPCVLKAPEIF